VSNKKGKVILSDSISFDELLAATAIAQATNRRWAWKRLTTKLLKSSQIFELLILAQKTIETELDQKTKTAIEALLKQRSRTA